MRAPVIAVIVLLVLFAAACAGSVDPMEQDLNADQFFQKAIEATDGGNYRLALRYYEVFVQKYPEDQDRNLWAQYEIAFLHHKMGESDRAIELLDELIARYDGAEGATLNPAPRVLAQKVKANILKEQRQPKAEPTGSPAGS